MQLQAAVPASGILTLIGDEHRGLVAAGTQAGRDQREWR